MFFKKKTYINWDSYMNKIDFIDVFYWQQSVRKENIRQLSQIIE